MVSAGLVSDSRVHQDLQLTPVLTANARCPMVSRKESGSRKLPPCSQRFPLWRYPMPLSLMTLSLVDSPVTLQEGLKILERDDHRCQYCGLDGRASFENALVMRVDFVVPRARKGKKDPSNLVACCTPCNTIKRTRVYGSSDEAKAYVLKQPEALRKNWQAKTARPVAKSASA